MNMNLNNNNDEWTLNKNQMCDFIDFLCLVFSLFLSLKIIDSLSYRYMHTVNQHNYKWHLKSGNCLKLDRCFYVNGKEMKWKLIQ